MQTRGLTKNPYHHRHGEEKPVGNKVERVENHQKETPEPALEQEPEQSCDEQG